jgi:isopentenyl-diphosphate delta-isomerase
MAVMEAPLAAAEGERDRKLEHIRLALENRMQLGGRFFDEYAFDHEALPEIDMDEIEIGTSFLGKELRAPLLVSCMTGGTGEATRINRNLAAAAERAGVALGVGSQRKALEDPATAASFNVRDVAPTLPLLANLGAVQLNYGMGLAECRKAVEMIGADALALHLNPLQEALQPEGQCNFKDLLPKIARLVEELEVPLVVKEIGCGLSAKTARSLVDRGVRVLDTAGLGGTSWARIEAARAEDRDLGELFADWGVPSPDSILHLAEIRRRDAIDDLTILGSGGVRTGIDVAKAIALGADLVGLAQPFLEAAMESAERVAEKIDRTVRELRITMFCVGARTLDELRSVRLAKKG